MIFLENEISGYSQKLCSISKKLCKEFKDITFKNTKEHHHILFNE